MFRLYCNTTINAGLRYNSKQYLLVNLVTPTATSIAVSASASQLNYRYYNPHSNNNHNNINKSSTTIIKSIKFHSKSLLSHRTHRHDHSELKSTTATSTSTSTAPTRTSTGTEAQISTDNSEYRLRKDRDCTRITLIGMISNIGLALFKATAGYLGNSVAMIADAAHSLSDLVTDIITLIASKLSSKPPDKSHPYGHGKYESIGAVTVSLILALTSGGIAWHAIENAKLILSGSPLAIPTGIALIGAIVSIIVKEILYRSTLRVGNQYNSALIKANAVHHRSDALSSIVALIGVGGSMLQLPILDPLAGLIVSGMIMKSAFELGLDSIRDLADSRVDNNIYKSVELVLESMKGEVLAYHELRGRRMGPHILLDLHIDVDPQLSVSHAHQVAERVRLRVLTEVPAVSELLVHVDIAETGSDSQQKLNHHSDSKHHSESLNLLMRPQSEIEMDIKRVLNELPFKQLIHSITHFTCHYVDQKLTVQLELVLADESMRIIEAKQIARQIDSAIRAAVPDVYGVDLHLELTATHINSAKPLADSQIGTVPTINIGQVQAHANPNMSNPPEQQQSSPNDSTSKTS